LGLPPSNESEKSPHGRSPKNVPLMTKGGSFPLRLKDRRDTRFQGGIVTS
jgi:hypothetical protein